MAELIVVALGGNAIISAKEKGTYEQQLRNIDQTTKHLAELVKQGHRLVITHGNGPQVGNLLIQHATASEQVPALPMDVCGAQSQGQIGYMLQQCLQNNLRQLKLEKPVATIITQVEVSAEDPAFKNPSKPVGPFYDQAWAIQAKKQGLSVVEDAGRGYRRVVASPQPKAILEIETIRHLLKQEQIVIASGGGGVPVVIADGAIQGVEAVIDKDLAGELLAEELGASKYIILTDVEQVAINYKQPNQENLSEVGLDQIQKYLDQGHFAPGSMLPKVQAAIKFVEQTKNQAIITHPFKILEAIEGKTGTRVV